MNMWQIFLKEYILWFCRLCLVHHQINNKKKNNSELFREEDLQMSSEHVERCLTSLLIRDMSN